MRVLLIEDDETIRNELAVGLGRHGFTVETRGNGRLGLLAACEARFDAIVLDLLLPEMNGYQVLTELRRDDNQTPVLVLTAKTGEHDVAEVLAAGADDFVSKPFRLVEVVARLANIVRRRHGSPVHELRAGDLFLEPLTRTVRRGNRNIDLTPTEFRILERLMLEMPEVITRERFLDEIWDPVSPPDPNIVQLYIGYIRRKIDVDFGTDTIRTVRGIGYCIDVTD